MFGTLLVHQWKHMVRAKAFSQGWGVKIFVGFLALYFGGAFLFLGFAMPEILGDVYPEVTALTPVFARFILFYMLADLAIRFFLQDLNMLRLQHYVAQPVKKATLIHFLLSGSIFSFFNLLPLFVLVPFSIRVVAPELGVPAAVLWFISLLLVVGFNHFTAIYVKRVAAVKQSVFIGFAAVVAVLFTGNVLGWFSLLDWSAVLFAALGQFWFLGIPLLAVGLLYAINYRFLYSQSYVDAWRKESKEARTREFTFLESRGVVGSMMANELKLILRNKRTRMILVMTLLLCAYGLIFYGEPQYADSFGIFIFVGIFMTGIFMINYGQFMIGWESAYFDGILTRAYPMEAFFKAKFWLLASSAVITYVLTTPYVYFGMKALYINTATFLFNLGFNTFVLLYASTYQKKRIELSKGSVFNYQGTSLTQFVIVLPLMALPVLIYWPFGVLGKPYWGLIALGAVGLISLAFHKQWFAAIVKNFNEKKYKNAAGFREG
jgi:hypothetical protein